MQRLASMLQVSQNMLANSNLPPSWKPNNNKNKSG
jgi:hypothetical protein